MAGAGSTHGWILEIQAAHSGPNLHDPADGGRKAGKSVY
jgi:hypothetical protein